MAVPILCCAYWHGVDLCEYHTQRGKCSHQNTFHTCHTCPTRNKENTKRPLIGFLTFFTSFTYPQLPPPSYAFHFVWLCLAWPKTKTTKKVTFYLLHWKKGSPVYYDQGKYDHLTFWEQIDGGSQFTDTKKFFTIIPVAM